MSDAGAESQTGSERIRKLRWKCRRGMKELDILLESFLEANKALLAQGRWPELEQLLGLEDDQLWDCMRQPDHPDHARFQALVKAIRQAPAANA